MKIIYEFRKRSIFYLERRYLEDDIDAKIKVLESKLLIRGSNKEKIHNEINSLNNARPCVIVFKNSGNISVMPITGTVNDLYNVEIEMIDQRYAKTNVKVTYIKTFTKEFFEEKCSTPRKTTRKKISVEEYEKIISKFVELNKLN